MEENTVKYLDMKLSETLSVTSCHADLHVIMKLQALCQQDPTSKSFYYNGYSHTASPAESTSL